MRNRHSHRTLALILVLTFFSRLMIFPVENQALAQNLDANRPTLRIAAMMPPPWIGDPRPIDPLILQYEPILYFHPDEDFYPMNVDAFVENSSLWDSRRSEEHTSELQSHSFISYAVFCLKKKKETDA